MMPGRMAPGGRSLRKNESAQAAANLPAHMRMDPSLVTDENIPINVISGSRQLTAGNRMTSAEREQNRFEAIAEQRKKLN